MTRDCYSEIDVKDTRAMNKADTITSGVIRTRRMTPSKLKRYRSQRSNQETEVCVCFPFM